MEGLARYPTPSEGSVRFVQRAVYTKRYKESNSNGTLEKEEASKDWVGIKTKGAEEM